MKTLLLHRFTVLALALLAIPTAATASDWTWKVTPYAWWLDVTGDVTINDQEVLRGQLEASDLLDDADFVGFVHAEGRRGKLGLFASLALADLGDEPRTFSVGQVPFSAKTDLEVTILDAGGVWYPSEDSGFGVHYGVRLIDVEQDIDVTGVGQLPADRRIFSFTRSEFDGLVGFRYLGEISESWSFALTADVSAGGTEGSWGGIAAFGYHFGGEDQYGLRFGYRHLQMEFEDEDRAATLETDVSLSGPLLGFTFQF